MKYFNIILSIMIILSLVSVVSAESPRIRGVYVYDEANRLSTEAELGLNSYLWNSDKKTGYEMVVVLSAIKLTVEEMETKFNALGVGKMNVDNGLALFIFPDNTAFGMIGKGHDRIAVPYVTTYGKRSLKNIESEPVLSILSFFNMMNKKLDEPTIAEQSINMGKKIGANLDIIFLGLFIMSLLLLLVQQKDGFQVSDLILPIILCVLSLFMIGAMYVGSETIDSTSYEFGIITASNTDHHTIVETHTRSCGKDGEDTCFYTDTHEIYTNDVKASSYDFREYSHRFETRDYKGSWDIKVNNKVSLAISKDNRLYSMRVGIDDNSGGKTERYGTWILTK